MNIAVELEPAADRVPEVAYRWDIDTDILTARIADRGRGTGLSGSVDIEGTDGSWLVLDVADGCISGVEVAVWPTVRTRRNLSPPASVSEAGIRIPAHGSPREVAALEVETPLAAEADDTEGVIHFRVGIRREVKTVRLARDVLLDLDPQQQIAGLWLLNVPPAPFPRPTAP